MKHDNIVKKSLLILLALLLVSSVLLMSCGDEDTSSSSDSTASSSTQPTGDSSTGDSSSGDTSSSSEHVHTWEDHYTVDVYPTAEKDGTVSIHCTGCDEKKQETTLPYSETCGGEHAFDEGTRVTVPGGYSYTVYQCADCDEVMVVVDETLTPAE